MTSYALLLSTQQEYDARAVAREVAEVCGRTSIDVMHQLYHGRGILAEGLAAEQAQELGGRLVGQGVAVFAVPDSALVVVPRPRHVTTARIVEEGFEVEDQLNRVTLDPWSRLVLLAGAVLEEETRELTPLQRAHRETARPAIEKVGEESEGVERRYYLDLCFEAEEAGAELRRYRIEAGSFSYHYLSADGRLGLRRDENFVTMTADIVRYATAGWVATAVRALARGEVERSAVVRDLKLFDAEIRWRLQVVRSIGPVDREGAAGGAEAGRGVV